MAAEGALITTPEDFTFGNSGDGLQLENGQLFGPVNIRYETYGTLDKKKRNAVLLLHAFSGDAHAAGYHSREDTAAGWWDMMVGPGKAFDTNRYFV